MLLPITLVAVLFSAVGAIDLVCMNITEVVSYRAQVKFCPLADESNVDYYRASVLNAVSPNSCDVKPDTRGHYCYISLEQLSSYNISGVVCDLSGSCSAPIITEIETPLARPRCLTVNGGFSSKPILDITICLPSEFELLTHYEILASGSGSALDCTIKANADPLSCQLEGPLPGTQYRIRARACTPSVCSEYFETKHITLPEVLECLNVDDFNSTQANVTLCPPQQGNPVLGRYEVEITDPKPNVKVCSVSQLSRANVTCTLVDLKPETWYKLQARGCASDSVISCSQWKHVEFRTLAKERNDGSDVKNAFIFLVAFFLISAVQ